MPELLVEAITAVHRYGNMSAAAVALKIPRATLQGRYYRAIAEGIGQPLERSNWTYPQQIEIELRAATVLIGGDAHFWPGQHPLIYQAFVDVAAYLKPKAIVLNGDMFDGTRVGRHGRLRGQSAPRVKDELNATSEKLAMLVGAEHQFFTIGNHDQRVDMYMANAAPEMDDAVMSLADYFPNWQMCWAVTINGHTEIRHRFRSGIHARHNNTIHSGRNIFTNHTHQLGITPFDDRNGRRWGGETGMLNWPDAPQFEYTEGAPTRWVPGFMVLTFDSDGNLLPPETCEWVHGRAWFRGASWGLGKPRVWASGK